MENFEHQFDQNIKNLLESYTPDAKPHWDHMQSKLQEEQFDEVFDHKIKSIFENAQANHEQLRWESFQSKLKYQADRRKKIITARIIETSLFLLFLWTLDNIGLTQWIPNEPSTTLGSPMAWKQTGDKPLVQYQNTSKAKDIHSTSKALMDYRSTNSKGIHKQTLITRSLNSTNEIAEPTELIYPENETHSSETFSFQASNLEESLSPGKIETSTPQLSIPSIQPSFQVALNASCLVALKSLEEIEMPIQLHEIAHTDESLPTLPHHIQPYKIKESKFIGFYTGLMVNAIQSPSFIDPDLKYTQARMGYQAGLRMDIKNEEWTVLTGVSYQNIRYQPNMSETLGSFEGGYFKIHFREIQAHLINLPVALNKTLFQFKKGELSAHMGLSLTASLKNNYNVDTLTGLSAQTNQSIAFIDTTGSSEILSRVRANSNKGLLEGGNIGTNSFASAFVGIRYTHSLKNNIVLFTELECSKMLGQIGFGPNQDKFLTTSLNTGISYRFQ